MMKFLILLSVLVAIYAKTINFKDCGSVGATIQSVDLSPCDAEPCQLHRGTNYTAHINFTANENTPSAKTKVYGIIGGVPVPFPVPDDACANNNLKCPVVQGASAVYTNSIFCSPQYPKIKLAVKWEVQDSNGKDLICFVAPLEIVD